MEGGVIIRHLKFLLLVNLVIGLPSKIGFNIEDVEDALQKVVLREKLEQRILDERSDSQEDGKSESQEDGRLHLREYDKSESQEDEKPESQENEKPESQEDEPVEEQDNSTETKESGNSWKGKPHSGNEIDSYFSHPDPDSDLTNELASFVIEDNGDRNTSHHPKGIENVEKMKSKIKGENHDVHKSIPGQYISPATARRGERHFEKKGFPIHTSLWPGGVVPYVIDPSLNKYIGVINKAIKQFEDKTCIKWVPKSSPEAQALDHKNFISFMSDFGCYSSVGMINAGQQNLSLQLKQCTWVPTAVHEMAHAIGQLHEMSRSDRDSYITMNWQNIKVSKSDLNIIKLLTKNYNPYDLESILQYSLSALSNGNGDSMTPKDPRLDFLANIANGLMFYDVKDINIAYGCAENCANETPCKNGGFVIHNCTCYCPDHLTGDHCEILMTDQDCGGDINLRYLQSTIITSPQYPNVYPLTKQCVWVIHAPVGSFINLRINDFDLANSTVACYHWLEVRYNMMGQNGPRFCSKMGKETITTTKDGNPNLMMLVFDSMVYDRAATKGFNLTVKAVGPGCAYDPCVLGNCSVDDDGNHACLCNEGVTGSACNIVNADATVHCSFEDGSHCFMKNVPSDDFDWTIETTYTITSKTGPTLAHGGSKYLYIEASYPRQRGNKALFVSNVDLKGSNYCFTMWYHMYGEYIGDLTVKTNSTTLWSKSGEQGNDWKEVYIDVARASEQKLIIEGVVGYETGDIAIDDLKLFPGSCGCLSVVCNNAGTCIEENGNTTCICPFGFWGVKCEKSVCDTNDCKLGTCTPDPNHKSSYVCNCQPGMTGIFCDTIKDTKTVSCTFEPDEPCFLHDEMGSDNFNWTVNSKWTSSDSTGPSSAHGGIYYSYIETSYPRMTGDKAVLSSYNFAPAKRCLIFGYHMFGSGIGSLTVSLSGIPLFTKSGDQGDKWNEAYLDIPDSNTYMVQFTGVRGSSYTGDIAIDDITVSPGACGCKTNPCVNGQCADDSTSPNGYKCTCDLYFSGDNCEIGACTKNLCQYGQCNVTGNDSYSCSCNQGFLGTFCDIAGSNAVLTCDFEPGSYCFLKDINTDDFDWTIQTGETPTYGTGPEEAINGQFYVYAETSSPRKQGDKAILSSHVKLLDAPRCLTFRYNMFGTSMGTLNVVLGTNEIKWSVSDNKGKDWHEGKVDINNNKVAFEAVRGISYQGDIALDDVKLSPGYCN